MQSCFNTLLSGDFTSELTYEFWPADDARSRKLLIVLHGRGDSFEGFHWLPEALNIEEFNFLFLNAPDPYGGGFSWYALPPRQGPGIVRSRRLLMDLLNRLQSECGLKPGDLFLFGFSQGCLMSVDLALRYPRALGGVVGASGYVHFMEEYPDALSAAAPTQRILMTHGHHDEVLPLNVTRVSVNALTRLGVHIDWREFDKEHTIDDDRELPEIKGFLKRLLELS